MANNIEQSVNYFFETFKNMTRFKKVDKQILRNGVIRLDVTLLYGLSARFLIDPMKRIKPIYIIGAFIRGNFKGLYHFDFPIDFSHLPEAREKVRPLERDLMKHCASYKFRLKPK